MQHKKEVILFLGPEDSPLLKWLRGTEEFVINTSGEITPGFIQENKVNFVISYGYRHVLKKDALDKLPNRAINLHIAYLPWNRGADPNFWSFVEGTPKGVTIHYLDEGVDTGDIIVQKEVSFDSKNETLATTCQKLQSEIQQLFKDHWPEIKTGRCPRQKQQGKGSSHKIRDRETLFHLLNQGWDTPVAVLLKYSSADRKRSYGSQVTTAKKTQDSSGKGGETISYYRKKTSESGFIQDRGCHRKGLP